MHHKSELEQQDDISLIRNIQNKNCNDSLNVLISRHTGICFEVAKRFLSHPQTPPALKEEIISHKDLVIYESAKTFNSDQQVKFGTWVGHNMRYFCLDQINEEKKHHENRVEPILSFLDGEDDERNDIVANQTSEEETPFESSCSKEVSDKRKVFILQELEKHDDTTKQIIKLRYLSDSRKPLAFRHIAPKVGLSIQGVINREKKFFKLTKQKKPVELNNN